MFEVNPRRAMSGTSIMVAVKREKRRSSTILHIRERQGLGGETTKSSAKKSSCTLGGFN